MSAAVRPTRLAERLGSALARFLSRRRGLGGIVAPPDLAQLALCLRPADVLLVEGDTRFSTVIKYLTQSTWSHGALYVGDRPGLRNGAGEALQLVEADVVEGVRAVPLSHFAGLHVRICRAVSLSDAEAQAVVDHAISKSSSRRWPQASTTTPCCGPSRCRPTARWAHRSQRPELRPSPDRGSTLGLN